MLDFSFFPVYNGSRRVYNDMFFSLQGHSVSGTMLVMAPKKDRHKGSVPFQIRMHPLFRRQLEKLVERNGSDLTEEIRIAIRERLERAGLWPPPGRPS